MRTSGLLWAAIEDAVALVADAVEAVAVVVDEVEDAVGEAILEAIDVADCCADWLPIMFPDELTDGDPHKALVHEEASNNVNQKRI